MTLHRVMVLVLAGFLSSPAVAQQQTPEQNLGIAIYQIGALRAEADALRQQLAAGQAALAAAQARVKALEEKYEPKPPSPPAP